MHIEPRWAYKVGKSAGSSEVEVDDETRDRTKERERKLLCVQCRNEVTTEADRIAVDDRHDHTFANPAGYGYRIGCFGAAPGVRPRGIPSGHWTWFPGYMWQLDVCTACGHHLGWRFKSRDREFHGLILKRLIEGDGGDA